MELAKRGTLLLEDNSHVRSRPRDDEKPARSLDQIIEQTAEEIAAAFKPKRKRAPVSIREDA